MALIVTVGAADSEAYLSVATADTMAAGDLGALASKWVAATTEGSSTGPNRLRKEAALRRATQDVDELVGYAGDRSNATQALTFPRLVDWTGSAWIIPAGIIRAVYRQAVYLFGTADVRDAAAVRRARELSNFTEPNVSGSLADPGSGRFDPSLRDLVQPFQLAGTVGWISLS